MRQHTAVFLLFVTIAVIFTQAHCASVPEWCYKPYKTSGDEEFHMLNSLGEQRSHSLPGQLPPYFNPVFIIRPEILPYTFEDEITLLATMSDSLHGNFVMSVIAAEDNSALVTEQEVEMGAVNRLSFNATLIEQTKTGGTDVICILYETSHPSAVVFSSVVTVYRVFPSNVTVKLNNSNFVISSEDGRGVQKPIWPYGYYINWGGWLETNITYLYQYAKDGFTLIHPISPFTPGNVTEFMDISYKLGMKWQFDLQHIWDNETLLVETILTYKDHPALLSWYIADEPDGQQFDPYEVALANNLIKSLDPYHPTSVVFNCYDTAAIYQNSADILMTDPYPIGVNASGCNDTWGDCGCDDCTGSPVDVPNRIAHVYELINHTRPVWIVPQAFGLMWYWKHALPTPEEEAFMILTAIVEGASGSCAFTLPGVGNLTLYPDLHEVIVQVNDVIQLTSPILMFGSPYEIVSNSSDIYVGAWTFDNKIVVIYGNGANETASYLFKANPYNNNPINTNAQILFSSPPDTDTTITIDDGVWQDTLPPWGTRVLLLPVV